MNSGYFSKDRLLKTFLYLPVDGVDWKRDKEGIILRLEVWGSEGLNLSHFPEEICELKFLEELVFSGHNIRKLPECIRNLSNLKSLDISNNNIEELPPLIVVFPTIKELYLADKFFNIPHRNLLECLNVDIFREHTSLKLIASKFEELKYRERKEQERLKRKFAERQERRSIVYPPEDILSFHQNCRFIILWMLNNNDFCELADFRGDPINMSQHFLPQCIGLLSEEYLIYKVKQATYMITELGKRRLNRIEMCK